MMMMMIFFPLFLVFFHFNVTNERFMRETCMHIEKELKKQSKGGVYWLTENTQSLADWMDGN